MTTSGHGTKRMLSRGPALLLAPLLLLCRGNPRFRDPDPRVCLFVFSKLFLIILFPPGFYLWFFFLSTGPRRVVGPPPGRSARWDTRRSPSPGRTKLSSSVFTLAAPALHPQSPRCRAPPAPVPGSRPPAWGLLPPGFGRCQRVVVGLEGKRKS